MAPYLCRQTDLAWLLGPLWGVQPPHIPIFLLAPPWCWATPGYSQYFPALLAVGLCTYRFSLLLFLLCPVPPKVRPLCPGSSLPQAHPQTAVGLQAAQSEALRNQEQRRPRHLAEAWLPGRREQVHPAALTVTAMGLGCRRLPCRPAASLGPLPFTPRD